MEDTEKTGGWRSHKSDERAARRRRGQSPHEGRLKRISSFRFGRNHREKESEGCGGKTGL